MWTTNGHLEEAFKVIRAWGFTYKTNAVWAKDKIGLGYYFRTKHETLLLATKGNINAPKPADRPPSVIEAPRRRHSQKPNEVYEAIEQMYPDLSKLELFARNTRPGWFSWGNEIRNSPKLFAA
jgi:N6-adenosine-specific RNA methylase IME4